MSMTVNVAGQVNQIPLPVNKALWPLFETVINSIQSLEESSITEKKIIIEAVRSDDKQLKLDAQGKVVEEPSRFSEFIVTDNGIGFNSANYKSFMEAYSQLKVKKGCKGIGRFLWLKAFEGVSIDSTYFEDGHWHNRCFEFSLQGISPEENDILLEDNSVDQTVVHLKGFKNPYRDSVAYALVNLAKKIIEHCLPYFITDSCPEIILKDNLGEGFNLNSYYKNTYKDSVNRDHIKLKDQTYTLYHMTLQEGADKNELHLCANNREVKSFALSAYIPNMQKRIPGEEGNYYYVGYLVGDYLDQSVNLERADFNFADAPLYGGAGEAEIVDAAVEYIKGYLKADLSKIAEEKKVQIDNLVQSQKPQYRLLLNRKPEVYNLIPAGLSEDKLDLELYKHQQKWEMETVQQKQVIEEKFKQDATSEESYQKLFAEYCESITELNRASLAEYVIHRKAIIDLLGEALEIDDNGSYSKEAKIHKIICPMQTTSDEVKLESLNLWLIDDRLAYHHFLASDKSIKSLPLLENDAVSRMDLAIFDAALSYTADPENINSISIVELKRPMRDDGDNDPILQVLKYVKEIKAGKVKKANGRDFGDTSRVSFYCYVIGDLTQSMRESAETRGLIETQDKQGYFGYITAYGAYVEVMSYDKILKDSRQRNRAFFDKLFEPKAKDLVFPEMMGQ